jgi:hypothetical protein
MTNDQNRINPSFFIRHSSFVIWVLLGLWSLVIAQPPSVKWLTDDELAKHLNTPTQVNWENRALRDALTSVSRSQQVAVLLDCRVDPERPLTLRGDGTLRSLFEGIAQTHNNVHAREDAFPRPAAAIGVTQLGSLIYVGPQAAARDLRTIAERRREEVRQLAAAQASPFTSRVRLAWDELATPKEILKEIADKARLEFLGLEEQVPHDLWPAVDLPVMSLIDRLTIVAVQFDLTFRIEGGGKQVRLTPITAEDRTIQRNHDGGLKPDDLAKRWREACPDAEIRVAGRQLIVRGRLEDHEWLSRSKPAKSDKTAKTITKGFTLTIKNKTPVELARYLAEQLKMELKMDEQALRDAGIDLDKRVSLTVIEPTLEKMLQSALAPAGLKHRLRGKVLEILPAK